MTFHKKGRANNGLIMVRNPALLQLTFDSVCALFDRVGLKTNIKKTEAMVFLLGRIRTCPSTDTYGPRMRTSTERIDVGGR